MDKISIINKTPNRSPKFLKTHLVEYKGKNREGFWEIAEIHDSVHVLVDVEDTKHISLVKQVRIPVLANDQSNNGEVIEACAGIVDKEIPHIDIAREEIEEELGYKIDNSSIEFIKTMKSNVGIGGGEINCFIAKVKSSDKTLPGGGLESEDIEEVLIPYDEVMDFIIDETHTDAVTSFLISYWHFKNSQKKSLYDIIP